jgi:hypothetical protein
MTQIGYMAIDSRTGQTLHLGDTKHPRLTLLEKLDRKHAVRIYRDQKDGSSKVVGYIVAGGWWTIYAVCEWSKVA